MQSPANARLVRSTHSITTNERFNHDQRPTLGAPCYSRSVLWLIACADDTPAETTTGDAADTTVAADPLTVGFILVGPENDRGWSQAHREGGEYLVEKLGAELIVIDKVNPADRPDTSVEQVIDDMVAQGADLIFATSDDMKDGILAGAAAHPDIPMVWSSGDSAWEDGAAFAELDNLANVMGQMEYGKMMAGCAAALKTDTGSIGFVGPLINDETRRLVNSAYLGANYCWNEYRGAPSELTFEVSWIGFWFAIPGVTLDPTQVTNDFIDGGADVIISGIDTTEAIVRTGQRAEAGEAVWAIPYDFEVCVLRSRGNLPRSPVLQLGPRVSEGRPIGDRRYVRSRMGLGAPRLVGYQQLGHLVNWVRSG